MYVSGRGLKMCSGLPDNTPMLAADESREKVLERVTRCGVIAVIRATSTDGLLDVARALLAGGVVSVEVTMTTPGALEGIRMLSESLSGDGAVIGVGTVMDAETCRR